VGAYDCRYRFERITLTPITGDASQLERAKVDAVEAGKEGG